MIDAENMGVLRRILKRVAEGKAKPKIIGFDSWDDAFNHHARFKIDGHAVRVFNDAGEFDYIDALYRNEGEWEGDSVVLDEIIPEFSNDEICAIERAFQSAQRFVDVTAPYFVIWTTSGKHLIRGHQVETGHPQFWKFEGDGGNELTVNKAYVTARLKTKNPKVASRNYGKDQCSD